MKQKIANNFGDVTFFHKIQSDYFDTFGCYFENEIVIGKSIFHQIDAFELCLSDILLENISLLNFYVNCVKTDKNV